METLTLPPPSAFGLPEKFNHWRPEQMDAITGSQRAKKRFSCHALPTGSGKSLVGIGAAVMSGWRCVYITSTKGLQKQLEDDFSSIGLVDVRGQGNHRCKLLFDDGMYENCDHGPCHAGYSCKYRMAGCDYYDSVRYALGSQLVVTNYKFWISLNRFGITTTRDGEIKYPLGPRNLLILDECHNAPDELSEAMSFNIEKTETEGLLHMAAPWTKEVISDWVEWSKQARTKLSALMEDTAQEVKEAPSGPARRHYRRLRELDRKLYDLSSCDDQWIAYLERMNKIHFAPVWPSRYLNKLVLPSIPNVMLLSATVRPKTANLLGIKNDDLSFFEYDSSFPPSLRPVIHIPTVRMNHRTTDDQLRLWLRRIDQIIERRLDRKGIVHTVSYDRRNLIMTNSEYSGYMVTHDSKNAARMIESFKRTEPPAILISPSVSTGYDFPYDECRYQIIGKLAFLDTRNKIAAARCKEDKTYSSYIAMQELIQSCGRGMRSSDDFCETLIIDDNIGWFMKRNSDFAPRWFKQSMSRSNTVPDPPTIVSPQEKR